MRYITLSRFHPQRGPEITLMVPSSMDIWIQEQVTRTLDILDNPGFFTQQYTSNEHFWEIANLYFEVIDPKARGGVQMALLSLILTDEDISTYIFQNDIYKLSDVLTSNPYFAQLLSGVLDKDTEPKFILESKSIIQEWLDSLPISLSPLDHKGISLFFCGFKNAGKSSIIKHLKEGRFLPTIPNLSIDIGKALIEGLQYLSIDIPDKNQQRFRDSWKQWLKFSDILVLVVDSTVPEQFVEVKQFLLEILDKTNPLAILVLCNKSDEKSALSTMNIIKSLELETLEEYSNKVTVIAISAKTGLGLSEAFGKIIEEQLSIQQINENKDQNICLIMAQWNEDTGPQIADFYPKPFPNILSKDELVVQAFTIGMNIFGKTAFKNNIISVPFVQQKLRSRLFFNSKISPITGKNENYLLGVFADLVTTNENVFGLFESEINHFMLTDFLNERIDLYKLYNKLVKLLSEKKRLMKRLSPINQHWLILFHRKNDDEKDFDVAWKFGSINEEMINNIKNFISSYSNTVAIPDVLIKCRKSDESFLSDIEIQLSLFEKKYVLIGTNFPMIAALINQTIIEHSPAIELTKNILSAHIMSKYAELFSNISTTANNTIDTIFDDAFIEMDIEPTRTIYAKNGSCNLSDLQIAEILYLHWYLNQRIYKDQLAQLENDFYVIIIKSNTKTLKFQYKIEKNTAQLLCNQLLEFVDLYKQLYGYIPEKIFIQDNKSQHLFYDQHSDLLLIINSPENIFLDDVLFKKLKTQKTIKKNDIEPLLKELILLVLNRHLRNENYSYYKKIWDILHND